ncbi:MAG: hypothetical protein K6T83_24190, partial [Alicyclobacillus sp.]|nr:hypothetical protein [Alicyclobacillus sp.]
MKHWLPFPKSTVLAIGAALLALWPLPNLPNDGNPHHHARRLLPHAIPTMAAPINQPGPAQTSPAPTTPA